MWTRWYGFDRNLLDPAYSLESRMERLLDSLQRQDAGRATAQFPRTTLHDTEQAFVLVAEVPGLTERDVQVQLHADVLTVSGQRRDDTPEGWSVHRKERAALQFSQSFQVPGRVDANQVSASVANGILVVTLPKAEDVKPRQIQVQSH